MQEYPLSVTAPSSPCHLSRGERLGTGAPSPSFPKGIPFECPLAGPQKGIKPAQPPWPIRKGHGGVFVLKAAPLWLLKYPHAGWRGDVRSIDILLVDDGLGIPSQSRFARQLPQGGALERRSTGGLVRRSDGERYRAVSCRLHKSVHELGPGTARAASLLTFLTKQESKRWGG